MNLIDFVKKNHRQVLWVVLAILFLLDIISTTIGLHLGHSEQTAFMMPFVGNPFLHGIIKLTAFIILYVVIEGLLKIFATNSQVHLILDIFFTFALIYLCCLFLDIVTKNIQVILR